LKRATDKKTNEPQPYRPVMRELRLAAVAERLALPEHAGYAYWAMINVLSAPTAGVHLDRVIDWFKAIGDGTKDTVEGPLVDWARMLRAVLPELIEAGVRVLRDEGLVTTEARMFQDAEGQVFERTKITILPVEEWENDRHFMAALAVRWAA
jgi:hypothetical protein